MIGFIKAEAQVKEYANRCKPVFRDGGILSKTKKVFNTIPFSK